MEKPEFRRNEGAAIAQREQTRRASNSCYTIEQRIKKLHDSVATGSVYVCSSSASLLPIFQSLKIY